jgi:L-glutamine-phosphate cytidylyltransferase
MKVVILAAGVGSRLDDSPHHLPKALTLLNPQASILSCQLRALASHLSLDQVLVVVGYEKEAIMSAFPDLLYVFNPDFKNENTSKSLLRALKKLDDDVLWLNGDVLFRPEILHPLLQANRTSMVVNKAVVGEEEVKYCADAQGRILEVSKHIIHSQGEALGINFFRREDMFWLRQNLEQCQFNDFFEKGIEMGLLQGQRVWSFPVEVDDCVEIDFPEDLIRAKQLVNSWGLV